MRWLIVGLFVSMVMFMMVPTDVHAQGNKVVAADLTVQTGPPDRYTCGTSARTG